MTTFESVAPVLPVGDLDAALARYERLGFRTWRYAGLEPYGYAERDAVSLHLSQVGSLDPRTSLVSAYLYVADAEVLYREWEAAEVDGRLHPPTATEYGLLEGAYVDPDGNLLRFGSRLTEAGADS